MKNDPRSYYRNFCNCVKKPELWTADKTPNTSSAFLNTRLFQLFPSGVLLSFQAEIAAFASFFSRIWLVGHSIWSLYSQILATINVEFPRAFEARSPRRGLGSRMVDDQLWTCKHAQYHRMLISWLPVVDVHVPVVFAEGPYSRTSKRDPWCTFTAIWLTRLGIYWTEKNQIFLFCSKA